MPRKKAQPETPPEPEKQSDPFIEKLQKKIEDMLEEANVVYKDRVTLISNAIKFLQVKHKIEDSEDGGSYFDDD